MLSRKEYIAICETCEKRKFDKGKGLVCSLTGEHANFEQFCADYKVDELAKKRTERVHAHSGKSRDALSVKAKNGLYIGIAAVIAGVVFMIISFSINRISFGGIGLIIGGLIKISITEKSKPVRMDRKIESNAKNDEDPYEVY